VNPELMAVLTLQALFDVAVVFALLWCRKELKGYRRMVQVMTADSPALPTNHELIHEWAEKFKTLPEGSPKWWAYKKRLIEVGYLQKD